jgi:deazaflavin-dependent oxidoreductase (nitroreductase family)
MDSPYETPPTMPKWMLNPQVWLLRRNLMGPLGKQLMVITTTGRKSGKQYSVPIGYVRDGDDILAFNIDDHSNWIKNARVNPNVKLNIRGKEIAAVAHEVDVSTPDRVREVLKIYQREQPSALERFFKATPDSPEEQLKVVGEHIKFMRFKRVDGSQ